MRKANFQHCHKTPSNLPHFRKDNESKTLLAKFSHGIIILSFFCLCGAMFYNQFDGIIRLLYGSGIISANGALMQRLG